MSAKMRMLPVRWSSRMAGESSQGIAWSVSRLSSSLYHHAARLSTLGVDGLDEVNPRLFSPFGRSGVPDPSGDFEHPARARSIVVRAARLLLAPMHESISGVKSQKETADPLSKIGGEMHECALTTTHTQPFSGALSK